MTRPFVARSNLSITDIIFVILGGIAVLFTLTLFFGHRAFRPRGERAPKQICANKLKGIGIALILYSNDYKFFPHMNDLNTENSASDVSTVFRTLVTMKYFDNPEEFVCPSSNDTPLTLTSAERDDPKLFRWDRNLKPIDSSAPPLAPIFDKSSDPKIAENSSLSYSYVKRKLNAASVRSDTILSADKAICFNDSSDPPALTSAPPGPRGNHDDGLNILYADAHVAFVGANGYGSPLTEFQRCAERLQLEGCDAVLKSRIKTLSEKEPPTNSAVISPVTSESGGN